MQKTKPPNPAAAFGHAMATTPMRPLRVESTLLMGGQRVLEIVHQGEVYRLQTTRLGKLILTK
jgi:hemin uptake protein HemP